MRRRLLQLIVLAVLVVGLLAGTPPTASADGDWWCSEWRSCEPSPSCDRLAEFLYRTCCTILDHCFSTRVGTGNCC